MQKEIWMKFAIPSLIAIAAQTAALSSSAETVNPNDPNLASHRGAAMQAEVCAKTKQCYPNVPDSNHNDGARMLPPSDQTQLDRPEKQKTTN